MDRRSSITPRDLESMLCDETVEPKALPLSLLEEITNGFSDEHQIGSGGFAVVFKGKLENMTVAVKRMSNTYMHEKEFQREVECLMLVKHINIIRFLGYCADTQGIVVRHNGKFVMADVQQRLLCFEYLPKGSLHEYISDTSRKPQWRDLFRIIIGICHGLYYLHQKNIVHLDLKPSNILLDDNLVAKIADFGLSRCFSEMQSRVITRNIGGTLGYLAPEFTNGEITYKFDIYSLGIIIIEILTGNKGYQDVDKVVASWSKKVEKSQSDIHLKQVQLCAEIGIECMDSNPVKRPNTQEIINRLDEIESMEEYIEIDMITSHQINPDMLTGTMHALWLSYQQLNPDTRRCIEYCSIFPKRSMLIKNELVCLWIAQGFIKANCATEDKEDVAESYIQELVSCSFLQKEGTNCFSIDDVLHDFLDKLAGNCFRIENKSSHREGLEGGFPRDIQHLLIQNYDAELITEKILGLEKLSTLIIYVVKEDTLVEERVIESICKRLPKLRVLGIGFSSKNCGIDQFFPVPESISQLKHLRYLALRTQYGCMVILPRALNKLHYLQLLDFGDGDILEFSLDDLINLRHIICFEVYEGLNNIGKMISLQTIPRFIIRNGHGYEVKQLRDLNKLCDIYIRDLGNVKSKEEALQTNLVGKERLTTLTLRWEEDDDILYSPPEVQAEVLEGLCPPVGLEVLRIMRYKGSRYPDWMVGKQNGGPKDLQILMLEGCIQLEGFASKLAEAFPHLRVLSIYFCSWESLPGNMEHLTSLKELKIVCSNIMSLPTLPLSLELFTLNNCDKKFMDSCKMVGHPNWQKIEHIARKQIWGYGK